MPSPYNNQVTIGYESLLDANGNSPLQLASAFQADGVDTGIPDLFGIAGEVTNGYRLGYHPNYFAAGLYWGVTDLTCVTPPPVTCTCGPGSPWSTTVTAPAR